MSVSWVQRSEPCRGGQLPIATGILVAVGLLCGILPVPVQASPAPVDASRSTEAPEADEAPRAASSKAATEALSEASANTETVEEPEPEAVPAWMRIPVIQAADRPAKADTATTETASETVPGLRPVLRISTVQVQADGSLRLLCGVGGEEHAHESAEEARAAHAPPD